MNAQYKPGIYLINKPRGRTSFSIVAQMRRLSGIRKVGHAGTLDPQAEGLLIVLVGKQYTKRSNEFLKLDKTYEFELKLGQISTTDDEEGQKTLISNKKPSLSKLKYATKLFLGKINQTPPQYSAIKIDGKRAYKIARSGVKVELKPRKVEIKSLKIKDYNYPIVSLEAMVSSGTYIRSLAKSLGEQLKTGAYCTKIVRTQIADYQLQNAITLD